MYEQLTQSMFSSSTPIPRYRLTPFSGLGLWLSLCLKAVSIFGEQKIDTANKHRLAVAKPTIWTGRQSILDAFQGHEWQGYSKTPNRIHLPSMALRWPSRVCKTMPPISVVDLPRNCSTALPIKSGSFMTFTCDTPVTYRGTPSAVSTLSHTGCSVTTSKGNL